jgi:hypothetical protein
LLLGLNGVEHFRKAGRVLLMPTPVPMVDFLRVQVEVKQDGRTFD